MPIVQIKSVSNGDVFDMEDDGHEKDGSPLAARLRIELALTKKMPDKKAAFRLVSAPQSFERFGKTMKAIEVGEPWSEDDDRRLGVFQLEADGKRDDAKNRLDAGGGSKLALDSEIGKATGKRASTRAVEMKSKSK